jgi:hypothetical protein
MRGSYKMFSSWHTVSITLAVVSVECFASNRFLVAKPSQITQCFGSPAQGWTPPLWSQKQWDFLALWYCPFKDGAEPFLIKPAPSLTLVPDIVLRLYPKGVQCWDCFPFNDFLSRCDCYPHCTDWETEAQGWIHVFSQREGRLAGESSCSGCQRIRVGISVLSSFLWAEVSLIWKGIPCL